MSTLLVAAGSFLLGVLCMDLAFDIQAIGSSDDAALMLSSISAYYERILGDNPMGSFVILAMLMAILGAVHQTVRPRGSRWLPGIALLLGASAIGLTITQVVPAANRIVEGIEPVSVQVELARRVAIIHVFCFVSFVGYVAIQVAQSGGRKGTCP